MTEPSEYELAAWRDIQRFKGHPLSKMIRKVGEQAATGAAQYLEKRPRAQAAVSRGQNFVGKAAGVIPDGLADWSGSAFGSMRKTVGRVSRAGLSPQRVVAKHRKRGHNVALLQDLRRLDLQQIDLVRGQGTSWGYPIAAALSGMGAGLVISGGELAVPVSGGGAAAPSGVAVAGALVGDAAWVLGLASRSVGHISLLYGYDPEEPGEKLFVMSIVNAGTAMSASAKSVAMADVSRLTQALVRGKTWAVLDKSILAQVSRQFANKFALRFTKQGLGKVVPLAGIAIGGTFNWATLESIVDAASIAYRRRFLLEKYPRLAEEEALDLVPHPGQDDSVSTDEVISVLDELAEVGGPDLHTRPSASQ